MISLSNLYLQLDVYAEQCCFNVRSTRFPGAKIENASFGLNFTGNKNPKLVLESVQESQDALFRFGKLQSIILHYLEPNSGAAFLVEFGMEAKSPFLFQRVKLLNNSAETIRPNNFLFSKAKPGDIQFSSKKAEKTAFYSNGWQSWSPSGTFQYGERQKTSRLGVFSHPMLYNTGKPLRRQKSTFSSDMFAALLDQDVKVGLICGFLSQKEQFGSLTSTLHPEPDLQVWANCDEVDLLPGAVLESDWLAWQFFDTQSPQPFDAFFEAVSRENQVRDRMDTPVGWCSWYHYFQNITSDIIQQNLQAARQNQNVLPLTVFQIDDGFQQDVGSWLKFNKKFPDGLLDLSHKINKAGYQPGVWLAPFIVEKRSMLNQEHPGWLLRTERGKPVNSGFVWNRLGGALDLTNPEVQEYVREVIRTAVKSWNFPYLKLDFLYGAALPGQHYDRTKTRAQILRKGLEIIREEAGEDTVLLGCGCPIGPGIGIFDLMRISADVSPDWKPQFFGIGFPFRNEPNMPSARNAIQNILTRANMDPHFWVNDPDCLLVREDSNLSLAEVQSLATAISLTGGAFLISDDLTQLSPERLKLAASLLPTLPPNPLVRDLFASSFPSQLAQTLQTGAGEWKLIALFNWADRPADLTLKLNDWGMAEGKYILREYWSGKTAIIEQQHTFRQVPAHGVRLVALRQSAPLTYLGSDLHLSQGIEVKDFLINRTKLEIKLDLGRKVDGNIFIYTENTPLQVKQNGNPVQWHVMENDIIRIPVTLNPDCQIQIEF